MRTLRDVHIGEKTKVKKIKGNSATIRRLMDMGITKNTEIYVRKVAPLGDPIQVSLRGFELTLRKEDADNIIMED